jgi:glucose-1-phosphate thymidylyltransferase
MEPLKGLILSGGKGTRLRPITHTSAKQLVPVANKPVLFYGIEAMAQAGIAQVGIIIAPETGQEIRDAAGDGSRFGIEIEYIVQDEPLGLAHAVLTAERFLGANPFVMYLGDNLLQGGIVELVDSFRAREPDALILLTPVQDPQSYGIAELDGAVPAGNEGLARDGFERDSSERSDFAPDGAEQAGAGPGGIGRVVRLVEKPAEPKSNLALVGVYMFTAQIHDAARAITPSNRGELEITDAVQHLVDSGMRVEPHIVQGWWKDTGRLQDMLDANRLVLDNLDTRVEGELVDSQVEGRVVVEPGARLQHATVRGPAIIGARARLQNCYVGPYTAIGEDCVLTGAEVEHSILLAGASVCDLDGRMESSLLGRNVTVRRGQRQPRAYRFMVGDNSDISIL